MFVHPKNVDFIYFNGFKVKKTILFYFYLIFLIQVSFDPFDAVARLFASASQVVDLIPVRGKILDWTSDFRRLLELGVS